MRQRLILFLICTPARSVSNRIHHVRHELLNINSRRVALEVHLHLTRGALQHVDIAVAIFPLRPSLMRSRQTTKYSR